MAGQVVTVRWDEEFVAKVDGARGEVPRSEWIRAAVESVLTPDADRAQLRWPRDVLEAVDRVRGDRSADDWLRAAVRSALGAVPT